MENEFLISEDGKNYKKLLCNHDSSLALSNTVVYKGKDEDGFAVFEFSNGMIVTAEYQDGLKEGEVYEYKIS